MAQITVEAVKGPHAGRQATFSLAAHSSIHITFTRRKALQLPVNHVAFHLEDDKEVSSRHSVVKITHNRATLKAVVWDSGSTNGTYLSTADGSPVQKVGVEECNAAELPASAKLIIGGSLIVFTFSDTLPSIASSPLDIDEITLSESAMLKDIRTSVVDVAQTEDVVEIVDLEAAVTNVEVVKPELDMGDLARPIETAIAKDTDETDSEPGPIKQLISRELEDESIDSMKDVVVCRCRECHANLLKPDMLELYLEDAMKSPTQASAAIASLEAAAASITKRIKSAVTRLRTVAVRQSPRLSKSKKTVNRTKDILKQNASSKLDLNEVKPVEQPLSTESVDGSKPALEAFRRNGTSPASGEAAPAESNNPVELINPVGGRKRKSRPQAVVAPAQSDPGSVTLEDAAGKEVSAGKRIKKQRPTGSLFVDGEAETVDAKLEALFAGNDAGSRNSDSSENSAALAPSKYVNECQPAKSLWTVSSTKALHVPEVVSSQQMLPDELSQSCYITGLLHETAQPKATATPASPTFAGFRRAELISLLSDYGVKPGSPTYMVEELLACQEAEKHIPQHITGKEEENIAGDAANAGHISPSHKLEGRKPLEQLVAVIRGDAELHDAALLLEPLQLATLTQLCRERGVKMKPAELRENIQALDLSVAHAWR